MRQTGLERPDTVLATGRSVRCPTLPRVLVLTDRTQLPAGRDLVDTIGRCVDAGLRAVVVRELDLPGPERGALCERLKATGVTVISSRRRFPGGHGVQLSATQGVDDAASAPFHGRSCHNEAEIRRAVADGAAYLTMSPVAASPSKPGYGPPIGLPGLGRLARLADPVPVFALGGITATTAADMRDAGAHGVAVMGAVMRADDPGRAFAEILEQVR